MPTLLPAKAPAEAGATLGVRPRPERTPLALVVGPRRRAADPGTVEALAPSMARLGQQSPITVALQITGRRHADQPDGRAGH